MVHPPLKPLYIATSWDDLLSKCDSRKTSQSQENQVIKSINSTFKEAIESFNKGDEERSYILFYRTAEIYKRLKKSKTTDMKYLDAMFPPKNFKDIIEKMEQLSASLSRRYEVLQSLSKKDNRGESRSNNNCSGDEVQKDQQPQPTHDLVTNNVTTCTELYKLISDTKKIEEKPINEYPSLLLLDVRPSGEFVKSNIDVAKLKCPAVAVLNIPGEHLKPGMILNSIESNLPIETVDVLRKRKTANRVVILDHESQDKESASRQINTLFDALWKVCFPPLFYQLRLIANSLTVGPVQIS